MNSLKAIITSTDNPRFNLAVEDWIFHEMNPDEQILFIWRNTPTVVIGRYQNPWRECDLKLMKAQGVPLCRRQSGGGAVYHDLGNTNYTFFSPRNLYDKHRNTSIVIEALRSCSIPAAASPRNDIFVGERKVSGSAFKLSSSKAYHHGTLLIDAHIPSLLRYLTPESKKLSAKGTASISSKVANLTEFCADITHEALSRALIESFSSCYRLPCSTAYLDNPKLSSIPRIRECFEMMGQWEWLYGKTPAFSHTVTRGNTVVNISSAKGRITSAAIEPGEELSPWLNQLLFQLPYDAEHVLAAKNIIPPGTAEREKLEEIIDWIASEI